jgi:hypothetical protein
MKAIVPTAASGRSRLGDSTSRAAPPLVGLGGTKQACGRWSIQPWNQASGRWSETRLSRHENASRRVRPGSAVALVDPG